MDRLAIYLFIVASCAVHNSIVAQEYYVQGTRPVYIISESGEGPEIPEVGNGRYDHDMETDPSEFLSRSGLTSSEEEVVKAQLEEDESSDKTNGSTKIPPNFSEEVNRNRRFPPRKSQPLKADPGNIDIDRNAEEEDAPSRGLSRFLWPFSVSVSKGGKGHGHGHGHGPHHDHGPPAHLGYYNHYPTKGKGHHHHYAAEPFKGLTEHDYEILESKGYKKYQLKKKKKVKKLKKKLKLKRILQKILEKKINYFDSLGIEGGDDGWGRAFY
jgi:hypothetical protein